MGEMGRNKFQKGTAGWVFSKRPSLAGGALPQGGRGNRAKDMKGLKENHGG